MIQNLIISKIFIIIIKKNARKMIKLEKVGRMKKEKNLKKYVMSGL